MSKFQQRHYEAIATALSDLFSRRNLGMDIGSMWYGDVEDRLVRLFASDNPNFKESKFRAACHKWTKDPGH